ncbi:hypothetical protein DUNSADRAFT_8960 [Dunaliella salina]|uniref:Peroxiredoxin-like 2A n=1 Tax=Dunaliella salina TaxID=3046 RepID=A0ABQ7GII5_DUNSA|nr:hypothetical protein DUNSADRAFT_8960 [Dunaliella salina]|eukprot:KAF5834405.1 hypothetical protein DUNSADRAFT_8960 [Dunaliella salina]
MSNASLPRVSYGSPSNSGSFLAVDPISPSMRQGPKGSTSFGPAGPGLNVQEQSTAVLDNVKLWGKESGTFKASALWKSSPVVLVLLRRPGCVLCRYQARELWLGLKNQLEKLGVRMVCIVHEWIDREVEAFTPYWPGETYFDKEKDFFKFIGNGKLLTASPWSLLNPFSSTWGHIAKAKKSVKQHNLVGNGLIKGGVVIIKKGGNFTYIHIEKELGLPAPLHEVMQGAERAVHEQ